MQTERGAAKLDDPEAADSPPKVSVRARGTFLGVTSLYWISLYLYVPILAPYAEFQGAGLGLVGLVISAYGLAQLLLRLPLGLVSDRLGRRKPFLAIGFVMSAAASIGFVYAPDPWYLVGTRFVSGISACAWVAFTVLFASYFEPSRATRAMGYITFCNTLSVMSATAVGGRLADLYGWTAPFWASAGVALLGLAAVALISEPRRPRKAIQPLMARLRSVVRYRELVLASTVSALGQFTGFATSFGFVPNYAVTIGASKTELGLLAMAATLAGSAATLLGGSYIAPRFGPRQSVSAGHAVVTVSMAAIPLTRRVRGLYLLQILSGFGRGVANPILLALSIRRLPESEKATAMGFYQAVYALGMFAGPAVAGVVGSAWGYTPLFLSSAVVGCVTVCVAFGLPRRDEG